MNDRNEFEKIVTWKPGMEWDVAVEEIRRRKEAAKRMGGKEGVDRQHSQGKLTVRERIEKLVDKGTFFEFGALTGKASYDANGDVVGFTPSPQVCGVAEIGGRPVTVLGNDFTLHGGSPVGIPHKSFASPMSLQYGIPIVKLLDGAGHSAAAYEQEGKMLLTGGTVFQPDVQLLHKVPVVSAIMGPAAGGVALEAVLSHFSVMVKGTGQIFPAGPPVVGRALYEDVSKEQLGGTAVHCYESGVIDNEAQSEEDCFQQIRQFLSYMPDNVYEVPPRKDMGDDPNRREEELLRIIPTNRKRPYDMYKLIRLIVDQGESFEMRKGYARSVITAFARMDGYAVGIIASNPNVIGGAIDHKAGQKMARFIDLCNFFSIPLVLIPDTPGVMIGSEAERGGTMRYGGALLCAACEATVPTVQMSVRKYYGMAGEAFSSIGGLSAFRVKFGWASGEWGAIPIEGGVAAAYRREIESSPDPEAKRKELETRLASIMSPFRCAEAGEVADMIDPRDTRSTICRLIRTAQPYVKRNVGPKRSVRP